MATVLDSTTTTTTNNLIGSPEPPRLSLVIDKPPSSSPFPSPSSSFLPPPRPGAHEFASKPPASARFSRKKSVLKEHVLDDQPAQDRQPQRETIMAEKNINEPRTPFTSASIRDSMLVSSRPAPPSPATSRRASAALSQRSTSSGSEIARMPSPSNLKRFSKLNQEVKFETSSPEPQQTAAEPQQSLPVKIRDFAFATTDARFGGLGPDAPRANRHSESGSETSSSSSDDDSDSDGRRNSGWGGFSWSGFANRLSWSSFSGGKPQSSDGAELPSKTDFDRNFDASSPADEKGSFSYDGVDGDEDEDANYGGPEGDEEEGGPLVPGRYRALYAFEPEGTAEMALEEDQVVCVIGRGGGVGWAVVEKEDGAHALVPESYLEFVEASREH